MAIYFGKTIAEKLTQADAYFAEDNHIRHFDWEKNTDGEKKAALNQAEREINLYVGVNLEDRYDATSFPITDYENYRPDYAVFEHAFFILDNTARTRSSETGVADIESVDYQEEERTQGVPVSPQAERFLRINRLQVARG